MTEGLFFGTMLGIVPYKFIKFYGSLVGAGLKCPPVDLTVIQETPSVSFADSSLYEGAERFTVCHVAGKETKQQ